MFDWLDKHEGRKEGSSSKAIEKEKVRQGYKSKVANKMKKKEEMAKKMPKPNTGMSRYSHSHNSGKDDNYGVKPNGKGTWDSPYTFDN